MKVVLIVAVIFLAVAAWVNVNPLADGMFIFAAFVLGGLWSKQKVDDA